MAKLAGFSSVDQDHSEDVGEEDTESHSDDEEDTLTHSTVSHSEEEGHEELTLEKNCFTLVVVGGRDTSNLCGGRRALFCVLLNCLCQAAVICVVGFNSPEYYFGNGVWLVPKSGNCFTILVKLCAVVLTLFQVIQEMQDISQIFHVLTHCPRLEINTRHKIQCLIATLLQYVFAMTVLIVALQLVLSRQRPMDTLWINYYVFLTLGFDNMLCRFLLFWGSYHGLEHELNWHFELKAPRTREQRRSNGWYKRLSVGLFLLLPMGLTIVTVGLAMRYNICPLTWLRFGPVSNLDPVLMIGPNLGVPESCCPAYTKWSVNETTAGHSIPVLTSVPCLAGRHPEDDSSQAPVLYWVVWPDRKTPPNSLQIMEKRGGDSNAALRWGSVKTKSYQMRVWLMKHDYKVEEVYRHLIEEKAGIDLYKSRFTYVGEWNVTDIPWSERTRIFVTAYNPKTRALSPMPVYSEVLLREQCAPHCRHCNEYGKCMLCETGFVNDCGDCVPCADNCHKCKAAHGCDEGECIKGYGIATGKLQRKWAFLYGHQSTNLCFPCRGGAENCTSCDMPGKRGEGELPCRVCPEGFVVVNGTCVHCPVENCERCSAHDECEKCDPGYTRVNRSFWEKDMDSAAPQHQCMACSPNCDRCDVEGPGSCDRTACDPGFTRPFGHETCEPCAAHCKQCNASGAGSCNEDMCEEGYTRLPEKSWEVGPVSCEACSSHCDLCTTPGTCERGHCEPRFGLQGDTKCSRCAEDHCLHCEVSWAQCDECEPGFGFSSMKTCQKCPENCHNCTVVDRCAQCMSGYRLDDEGQCAACADQCRSCDESGEGFCDPHQCEDGWTTTARSASDKGKGAKGKGAKGKGAKGNTSSGELTCRMCVTKVPNCKRCDARGPEHCDDPTTTITTTSAVEAGGTVAAAPARLLS